jgi:hypothetical protein
MVWGLIRVGLFGGSFLIGLLFFGPRRPANITPQTVGAPHLGHPRNLRLIPPSAGAMGRDRLSNRV